MKLSDRFAMLSIWNKIGLIGAIASIIGLASIPLAFMLAGGDQIDPRYAVDWHDLIAAKNGELPQLRLIWEGNELPNLYTARVAIWNQGRHYMDIASISKSDPIRLTYPAGIKVLSAQFIKSSRGSLALNARLGSRDGLEVVFLDILGDDGLEQYEGGVLRLVFTKQPGIVPFGLVRGTGHGSPEPEGAVDFSVIGRVKSSASGFQKTSWNDATSRSMSPLSRWALFIFMVACFAFGMSPMILVGFGLGLKGEERPQPIIVRAIMLLLFIALISWVTYRLGLNPFVGGPTWIR